MSKPIPFNPAELAATLQRMTAGTDHGMGVLNPAFDTQQHKELAEAARSGRKIEDYQVALESYGFRWIPSHVLPRLSNGQQPTEGQWRSNRMRMGWTENDILTMFEGPESLVIWMEYNQNRKAARRAGLVLPPPR